MGCLWMLRLCLWSTFTCGKLVSLLTVTSGSLAVNDKGAVKVMFSENVHCSVMVQFVLIIMLGPNFQIK